MILYRTQKPRRDENETRTREERRGERRDTKHGTQKMGFRIRIKSNYASDLGKLHFTGGDITLQEQGTNEQRDRERPVAEMRGE